MNPWINYHHLYYFKTIAEEGSVSGAAEKLKLGQPTLSAQLKQFEDTLGIELFERRHKKLILTEQGKTALDYARGIFKLGSEMYEALHDRLTPTRTNLQIGALDSIPKQIILQLAKAAYKVGPCNVSLVEGSSDEMMRELVGKRLDLFVTNYLPQGFDPKSVFHRSIAKHVVSVFGAPKFKKLRKNYPESISNQQFIMPTYSSRLRYDVEHWAKLKNLHLDIVAETQDIGLKKLMAVDGLGLITAATHTVSRQVLAGDLVEIGRIEGVSEELFLMSAERRVSHPIASVLFKAFSI